MVSTATPRLNQRPAALNTESPMFSLLTTGLALLSAFTSAKAESHMYAGTRFGAAFASGYVRTAYSPALAIGAQWDSGIQLGMRLVVLPLPPEVYGADTPDLAIGPLVDWAYHFKAGQNFELYPTMSVGIALGKSPRDGTNQIMPQWQTGFGAHYLIPTSKAPGASRVYIGPEFGIVPLVVAPYVAGSAGLIF